MSSTDKNTSKDPNELKLFIGGLSWETNVESFRAFFESISKGDIIDTKMPLNHMTGTPRGFGFVGFTKKEDYDNVLDMSKNRTLVILGKNVEAKPVSSNLPRRNYTNYNNRGRYNQFQNYTGYTGYGVNAYNPMQYGAYTASAYQGQNYNGQTYDQSKQAYYQQYQMGMQQQQQQANSKVNTAAMYPVEGAKNGGYSQQQLQQATPMYGQQQAQTAYPQQMGATPASSGQQVQGQHMPNYNVKITGTEKYYGQEEMQSAYNAQKASNGNVAYNGIAKSAINKNGEQKTYTPF